LFWQEWFADWATYLIYNPHLALLPWGSTLWTTPNKPWALIAAYGWYYTLAFLTYFWLVNRLRELRPNIRPWVACVGVGLPLFYLVDLLVEGGASLLGMWSYDSFVGPAIISPNGTFPLLYPVTFFAAWCTFMGTLLYTVDANGYTAFDRFTGIRRWAALPGDRNSEYEQHVSSGSGQVIALEHTEQTKLTIKAQVIRAIAWIVGFNLAYWVLFVFPMILIRIATGEPSSVVP
jgi:hypothetical protein